MEGGEEGIWQGNWMGDDIRHRDQAQGPPTDFTLILWCDLGQDTDFSDNSGSQTPGWVRSP